MIDFRVETFLKLCETMNYTKTAEILNITQPTVTGHIKHLEKMYNCNLFKYSGKILSLTKKGEKLLNFAISMRASAIRINEEMLKNEKDTEKLVFGATKTIGEFVVPEMVQKYLNRNPDATVDITVDNTKVLLKKLDEGKLYFVLVEGFFDKSKYYHELIKRQQFIAVCSKKHKFAGKTIDFDEVLGQRIFVREEGSGTRAILEQVLAERSLKLENFSNKMVLSNFGSMKRLVACGLGVTFVYKPVVQEEIDNGIFSEIKIRDFNIKREFNFVCHKNSIFKDKYKDLNLEF